MQITSPILYRKPEGVIVRRSTSLTPTLQRSTISSDARNKATIASNDSLKTPGEIRIITRRKVQKVDEQVFYNADVYAHFQKPKEIIQFQSAEHVNLPVKGRSKSIKNTPVVGENRTGRQLASIEQQSVVSVLPNAHGEFDLQKFREMCLVLREMMSSLTVSTSQLLAKIQFYVEIACQYKVDDFEAIKLAPIKKQLVRQSMMLERQAIMALCMVVVIDKLEKVKNYCSNLLQFSFENSLVCLNLLTQESNQTVLKFIKNQGNDQIIGKGNQYLRTNNDIIADLIRKIVKTDPLFAQQFNKISDNYRNASVKSFFYALLTLFSFYINAIKADHLAPFMAVSPAPFLIEDNSMKYTLVIDFQRVFLKQIDSTRKISKKKEQLTLRPYTHYFLKQMSKYYEIISFSDSMPLQNNKIINLIDQSLFVKHRLYRYQIDHKKGKEMKKIGRNVDRLVLVDTVEGEEHQNLMMIRGWRGQANDAQLAEICPLLATIVVKGLSALQSLQKIREAGRKNDSLGLKYINCGVGL